jgi:hypothetical protein
MVKSVKKNSGKKGKKSGTKKNNKGGDPYLPSTPIPFSQSELRRRHTEYESTQPSTSYSPFFDPSVKRYKRQEDYDVALRNYEKLNPTLENIKAWKAKNKGPRIGALNKFNLFNRFNRPPQEMQLSSSGSTYIANPNDISNMEKQEPKKSWFGGKRKTRRRKGKKSRKTRRRKGKKSRKTRRRKGKKSRKTRKR